MKKTVKELMVYAVVGIGATVVEWLFFYILNEIFSINYLFSTTIAFIFSTFVNWLLGRALLFKKKNEKMYKELINIYIVSIIGLLMNLFFMWILINKMNYSAFFSKIISTGIIFIWNFMIRKFVIYNNL